MFLEELGVVRTVFEVLSDGWKQRDESRTFPTRFIRQLRSTLAMSLMKKLQLNPTRAKVPHLSHNKVA